jgi:Zn-dependent alcohol dehydrogenase
MSINFAGAGESFQIVETGEAIQGQFFGQSSFATHTIVAENSIVNVAGKITSEEELKLFSPLGCGLQTGAGTITEVCKATLEDIVVVMGLGGVGLAAIMVSVYIQGKLHEVPRC